MGYAHDELLELALMLRGWSREVVVLTDGRTIPAESATRLERARVRVDPRSLVRLCTRDGQLHEIGFERGEPLRAGASFARPPQRQVPLATALGLALDDHGFVRVDAATHETSRRGLERWARLRLHAEPPTVHVERARDASPGAGAFARRARALRSSGAVAASLP